jgi:hypothetical protein
MRCREASIRGVLWELTTLGARSFSTLATQKIFCVASVEKPLAPRVGVDWSEIAFDRSQLELTSHHDQRNMKRYFEKIPVLISPLQARADFHFF